MTIMIMTTAVINKLSTRQQDPGDHIGKKGESELLMEHGVFTHFLKVKTLLLVT